MKVAAAVKDGVIAPALNESTEVMIVTEENGQPVSKEVISLDGAGITSVLFKLSMQNIDVMLAGEVGYVFQNPDDQIFKYNVMDEIMFGPMNIGMDPKRAEEEAKRALELTGLSGKEKENPYDLELYERKMTAIASVLAMDTDVLILDEPTIAQDWKGRQIIGGIIRSLSERGKLVIAILHDMDFVAENFERVIIMAHGQVLADGTARDVFMQDEALKKARLQKPYMMQLGEVLGYERAYLTVDEILRNQVS